MNRNRALNPLLLVLLLMGFFSVSSLLHAALGRGLLAGMYATGSGLAPLVRPRVTLSLLGFLWTTYRRWKTSPGSEDMLQELLSSIHPLGLIVVGPDRTIRMCNPTVTRIFGYPAHEVTHSKTDLLYKDRRSDPGKPREVYEALERDGFHVGTATGIRQTGETFPLEIITGNLDGREGAVLLLRDITERVRSEEQLKKRHETLESLVQERTRRLVNTMDDLRREIAERIHAEQEARTLNLELERRVKERTHKLETAYEELKAMDRLKDEFLSTVSHEFRTPLTSIMSFSEILLDFPEESTETKREFTSIILDESRRLCRLINDLLDLSKIQAGKMQWHWQQVDPAQVVSMAIKSVQAMGAKNGLHLQQEATPALPPFYGDPDRILQVLVNLLSNAIKFTPGGGYVKVRAVQEEQGTAASPAAHIRFSVEDSGPGIAPEEKDRIFEAFAQCTDMTASKPDGTGLGLSICRKIVAAHRGRVWVDSTPGQGSTFHASIPLDRREQAAQAGEPLPDAPAASRCSPLLH